MRLSTRSPGQIVRHSAVLRILGGFALAALLLALLGWLVTGPYREFPAVFDSSVRAAIRQMQSPMWTALFLTVTKLGSTLYLWIIGVTAGIVFILLRWFRSLFLFIVVMGGQAALHHGLKWLFARPRPSQLISYRAVEGFSFPSGHTIAGLCLFGMIAWIVTRRIENSALNAGILILTVVLVFLIGLSRAYIGIHYPTDVVAGFLGGMIWLAGVMSVERRPL